MRLKIVRVLLLALCCMLLFGGVVASAVIPYATYTYSVSGRRQISPDAYVPLKVINSATIKKGLDDGVNEMATQLYKDSWADISKLSDVYVDKLGYVYLADEGTGRIICLDENYNVRLIIQNFTNHMGVPDSLSAPGGVFVSDTEILVADTGKSRIVIFDKVGNFKLIVPEPSSDIFPEDTVYKPVAVCTNSAGTIYVVVSSLNYGVLSLNRDGSFNAFIGPQKVTYSNWQMIRRIFMTEEQKRKMPRVVSVEFNNLIIDNDGFLYVTTAAIDPGTQQNAISSKDKSDKYAPVKKLNPSGKDVMLRNGFYPPSGEVDVAPRAATNVTMFGASTLVDVALGPNGMWSIIDQKRSKVFTYDNNGNLLFAFGDKGDQIGLNQNLVAISYQGTKMLLADQTSNTITVYKRTSYGDLLAAALQNTEDQNYSEAVKYYISILQHNNNYDAAYIGIAESLYRAGNYTESMQYYRDAYDTAGFSKSYHEYRKIWVENWILVIPAVVIVFFVGWSLFMKYAKKQNIKNRVYREKRTIKEELLYAFHVILHPFDGFWDLKHEKRGGVRGATIILLTTILVFIYQAVGRGYLYNSTGVRVDYLQQVLSVAIPLLLWVVANWCLTTLFDGEGTFKDIYIATCYALTPLPILILPTIWLSNVVTVDEMAILGLLESFAFFWLGLLIFFGMMVTHDYTLGKNILTVIGTIVGATFIMFICVLFGNLIARVFTFFYNIYVEISIRQGR